MTPDSDHARSTTALVKPPAPGDDLSIRSSSSSISHQELTSPSPLQHQLSTSSANSSAQPSVSSSRPHLSPPLPLSPWAIPISTARSLGSPIVSSDADHGDFWLKIGALMPDSAGGGLDVVEDHYIRAYSAPDLEMFRCDRVRKLPLSRLDPSMLIGFLCKTPAIGLQWAYQSPSSIRARWGQKQAK